MRDHLAILFRHHREILAILVATVVVAGPGSFLVTKVYRAELHVLIKSTREPLQVDASTSALSRAIPPKDYVKTEVSIFQSPLLMEQLVDRLGPDHVLEAMQGRSVFHQLLALVGIGRRTGPKDEAERKAARQEAIEALTDNLQVQAILTADVFEAKLDTPDPEFAALALNTLAQLYLAHHLRVRQAAGISLDAAGVSLIEQAAVPWKPVRPRPALYAVLGIVAGLIGGVGWAYLAEYFRRTFASKQDFQRVLGRPVWASLSVVDGHSHRPRENAIQLRSLSEVVYRVSKRNGVRRLWVTSARRGEGKSYVAMALARGLSGDGFRVLVIDDQSPLPGASSGATHPNLQVLPGGVKEEGTSLADVEGIAELTAQMRDRFDLIVINGPALGSCPEGLLLASEVDGILLVVEAERTPREVVAEAVQMLEESGGQVLGMVLNKCHYAIPSWISDGILVPGRATHTRPRRARSVRDE